MESQENMYGSPSTAVTANNEQAEPPFIKAWLMFFLVATIGGGLAGLLAGAAVGAVMGAQGFPTETIELAGSVAGGVVSIPVSFFAFKWAVKKFILGQS